MNIQTKYTQLDSLKGDVVRIWQENRCLKDSSIQVYFRWIQRFLSYCKQQNLDPINHLTLEDATQFANWHANSQDMTTQSALCSARSALGTWAMALGVLGISLPSWPEAIRHPVARSQLLKEFAEYLRVYRSNPEDTIRKKVNHVSAFLTFLRSRGRRVQRLRLQDLDDYIIFTSKHYAHTTLADICSTLRRFCQFLFFSQRITVQLASSIQAPKWGREERPYKALPWTTVQRILASIDRQTACGRRDYALLLLMSAYGLGAGEVIRLTLDDIDWNAATFHVVRPKTGVEFQLPLLPAVAEALANYIRYGRPAHALTRDLFVTMRAPHKRLASSVTIRHILHKYAQPADVNMDHLGTHVLRHTHACQQMELGVPPKVIGDILGHRNPASTSAYLRVSIERLRDLALAVPI